MQKANYGYHISEYSKEIKDLFIEYKCKLYQTFISDYVKTLEYQPELKPVIHCSFYINIASDKSYVYHLLKKEIKFCLDHNIKYYVLHLGSCGKKSKLSASECINNMFVYLKKICKHYKLYKNNNFNLCLEILGGNSADVLNKIEDINNLFFESKLYYFKNLKICLDTCHLFVSGIDISTIEGFNDYINKFNKIIGLNRLGIVHLNNSLSPLDSKDDRHADIKDGYIKPEVVKYMFNYFSDKKINMIFEMKKYSENLKFLFSQ